MEKINEDFNIPYYIFEEILEYVELTAMGKCKTMKWENIKSLLNLAVINNCLTEQQAKYLKETFCREEKRCNHTSLIITYFCISISRETSRATEIL